MWPCVEVPQFDPFCGFSIGEGCKKAQICPFTILQGPKKPLRSLENLSFPAICNSMSTCSHYTWAPASLACGLRTTPPGGMVGFQKNKTCLFLVQKYTLTVFVQVDLPNIETGSPHMSGTVRDKIFVGQVSRKRNARECQEWCQVNKPEHQDVDALGET